VAAQPLSNGRNVSGSWAVTETLKAQSGSFALGRQFSWLSVNDIRRMLDLEPVGPEGDVYRTPTNMQPISDGSSDKEMMMGNARERCAGPVNGGRIMPSGIVNRPSNVLSEIQANDAGKPGL